MYVYCFRAAITMDMIALLPVEAEVVVWVLPGGSSDEVVDLGVVVVVLVDPLEDRIRMKIRYKYILSSIKTLS